MKREIATSVFESLSSGIRLDVFRLLVRREPEGMVAGEIASTLDVPPTNLSFHLKALTQARLLTVTQEGRFLRYRASIALMLDLIAYLTEECCGATLQQCGDFSASAICPQCAEPVIEGNLGHQQLRGREHPALSTAEVTSKQRTA